MLNFLQPGTYIRPHMHPRPHAIESLVLIQGCIRFLRMSAQGLVEEVTVLKNMAGRNVLDIEPLVWHSFVVTEADTVLFECKMGPYDANLDKTFASWAPDEGADGWMEMLGKIESACAGDRLTS
jgi:cupin fold WbuC family metalloprotein